ncbi:hypothetical protein AVEN_195712-1 [Araneus ventricosus]|uniref:Uncharacterized protein n=1 Tax=Araneus ventricosus TaxID=182803 RepID=A0A4Y2RLE1_ARAVE|nr:hypothetical protein AVEN_195712-1 [Araneus ventricosus]
MFTIGSGRSEDLHFHRVDDFISAEISNSQEDPDLFCIVTQQMVHGPCGSLNPHSQFIKDGICTKQYPRPFLKETQTGQGGYPLFRHRSSEDGGVTANISFRRLEVSVDNTWVVPYSPLLTKILNAHINVEYCNSVKSIKYVCKYVSKGSDMAVFGLNSGENYLNEIH